MARSATYRQLQAALETPGCPVCHLGQKAGRNYLDGLLWESVTDPDVSAGLVNSLGFCGRHSRESLSFSGRRLGVAITQQTMLRAAVRGLEKHPAPSGPTLWQRVQGGLARNRRPAAGEGRFPSLQPCPPCIIQEEAEERALQALLAHFLEDLDEPLQAAGGLCWPHLQEALRLCRQPPVHAALIDLHRRLWQDLIAHLGEFIRKNDHRFHAEEIDDEERAAIERSILLLTGEYPIR
jgi:hypothetical protein